MKILHLSLSVVILCTGCNAAAQRARLARSEDRLQTENNQLRRTIEQREEKIAALTRQVESLQSFSPDRPVAAFAPVKLEIASRSGGTNLDETPGDDGVTVHLRLLDADGDAVKSSGRVRIQVLDNQDMATPRVVALCEYNKIEELREAWHGRFGTSHFTFRCPFATDQSPPEGPSVDVRAEFTDYQTGETLATVAQVPVSRSSVR